MVIRYRRKSSGYSHQQLTRLIARYRKTGRLQRTVSGFEPKYTGQDIRLLAAMDERHDTPGGSAVMDWKILVGLKIMDGGVFCRGGIV